MNPKSFAVTIQDVDTVILNYITNILNPVVEENKKQVKVPVFIATPERWKSIAIDGVMRDPKNNKIILPAIVIRNAGISKNNNLPTDKLDGLLRKTVRTKWSKANPYNEIIAMNPQLRNQVPYYSVEVPDYVEMSYEITSWTSYTSEMNAILEKFIYAEGKYWFNEFHRFLVNYSEANNTIELNNGENRIIKNVINAKVLAYLLPESYDNTNTSKILKNVKIDFTAETETTSFN